MSKQQFDVAYYREHVDEFIEEFFVHPETGRHYKLYDAEKLFIEYMFKLDPDGRPIHTDLVYPDQRKSQEKLNLLHYYCRRRCCYSVASMRKGMYARMIWSKV